MENKAFKTRVKPFIGGIQLLNLVGFEKSVTTNEEGETEKKLLLNTDKLFFSFSSWILDL